MRCRDATPLLSAALDDELAPDERQALTVHVATCARCHDEQRAYERLRAQLRVGEPIAVDLVPALRAQLDDRHVLVDLEPERATRRPRRARVAGVIALVAALIAALVVVVRRPAPVRVATRPAPVIPQLRAPGTASLLLAWTTGGLPADATARTRAIVGVRAVTEVRGTELLLTGEHDADGHARLHLPAGATIPLDALAIDPATYARDVPGKAAAVVRALPPDGALLGATSARLRGIGVGGTLTFGGTTLRVTGVVADSLVGAAEIVVRDDGPMAVPTPRFLLVAYRGDRSDLETAIRVALQQPVRFRAPGETPYLRQGDAVLPQAIVKARFGEFWYRRAGDGLVTIDPAWIARNIVTIDVTGLGPIRVNRGIASALKTALDDAGLHSTTSPVGFEAEPLTARLELSRHTWGIGIALPGAATSRPATIAALARAGFRWGGLWLNRSPDYFEWVGSATP
ncbi:MAG TPA: zf-HC2 domain-containing protein [Acidimicrobiia bacterium]|nr:zf-HC2 domain-containing protein [Acidimicrobiia bacterium]